MSTEATIAFKVAYNDLVEAIAVAMAIKDMASLTNVLKTTLVDGVRTLKREVAELAWDYYTYNDFELTDELIPILRDVVAMHVLGGEFYDNGQPVVR